MSAGLLREAAQLMRERAEDVAATPWFCTSSHEERFDGYEVWTYDEETHWTVATAPFAPAADHIASWHPVVALAVADWLEATATENDSPEGSALDFLNFAGADALAALAVARTYLGSDR